MRNVIQYTLLSGTPATMAPEVLVNFDHSVYSSKSDCWSLGVILYQLLCGQLPHNSEEFMSGERWEAVSEGAKDLVLSLIQEDPNDRLSAAQALQHCWFQGDLEVCRRARNIMFDTEDSVHQPSEVSLLPESSVSPSEPEDQSAKIRPSSQTSEVSSSSSSSVQPETQDSPSSTVQPETEDSHMSKTQPEPENGVPGTLSEQNMKEVSVNVEAAPLAEDLKSWQDKKDQSSSEGDEEGKENFENIRSRLRPRTQMNYFQNSTRSPVTPSRIRTKIQRNIEEIKNVPHNSVKRKINDESKQGNWSILGLNFFERFILLSSCHTLPRLDQPVQ